MVVMIIAAGLPNDKDEEGLKNTGFWRIILGFPLFLYFGCFFGTLFLIRHETPKFLIIKKDFAKALDAIKSIYHESEPHNEIMHHI